MPLLLGAVASACGLSDLFRPSGLAQVRLTYPASDTILSVGTTTRPAITVEVGGVRVPDPHLRFISTIPTIIEVTAAGDSLIARSQGRDTIVVTLLDPIFTDTMPTIRQRVTVRP